MIKKIPPEAWGELEEIFDKECDGSALPPPAHSVIWGVYDEDKLKGFILVEDVAFIGQIFALPPYGKQLVSFVRERYGDQSVACVASEERFGRLFESLGMDEIKGTLYRR